MLLDTNIVIYGSQPGFEFLDPLFVHPEASISAITLIEALGFPDISHTEREKIEKIISGLVEYVIDSSVINRAVALRQQRKMGLGDSIIAATALENGLSLVTRNLSDFNHIPNLSLINPFESKWGDRFTVD